MDTTMGAAPLPARMYLKIFETNLSSSEWNVNDGNLTQERTRGEGDVDLESFGSSAVRK